jgi:hypothetical protein
MNPYNSVRKARQAERDAWLAAKAATDKPRDTRQKALTTPKPKPVPLWTDADIYLEDVTQ